MFALTYSDESGRTHLLFHGARALVFNTMEEAKKYEVDIFVPYLEETIQNGVLVKRRWFRPDIYERLSQTEIRRRIQIGSTLTIRKIENIQYKK
ncbi:hypothetical protein ZPAH1_orf00153 [Aeromonas phage ZPAH1]|nr:hypothetical protein ASwh1_104 [Aeromonas phage Aswh_1]QQG33915.1 hypothetical protein ZPAH1_orf00153 [Aeromonas phage ZPAH1]